MNIPVFWNKIKRRVGEHRQMALFIGILAITAVSSFYIGYVARAESYSEPLVNIMCPDAAYIDPTALSSQKDTKNMVSQISSPAGSGAYVASKNGKKYYPLACSGAKRIKEENKVFFKTSAEAESAGYSLGAGCTGS